MSSEARCAETSVSLRIRSRSRCSVFSSSSARMRPPGRPSRERDSPFPRRRWRETRRPRRRVEPLPLSREPVLLNLERRQAGHVFSSEVCGRSRKRPDGVQEETVRRGTSWMKRIKRMTSIGEKSMPPCRPAGESGGRGEGGLGRAVEELHDRVARIRVHPRDHGRDDHEPLDHRQDGEDHVEDGGPESAPDVHAGPRAEERRPDADLRRRPPRRRPRSRGSSPSRAPATAFRAVWRRSRISLSRRK